MVVTFCGGAAGSEIDKKNQVITCTAIVAICNIRFILTIFKSCVGYYRAKRSRSHTGMAPHTDAILHKLFQTSYHQGRF